MALKYQLLLVLLSLLYSSLTYVLGQGDEGTSSAPCTVCLDGSNNITRPDYLIELPGFPPVSCQTATFLASAVSSTSEECKQARLLGSPLCGCALLEERPCLLCAENNPSSVIRFITDIGVTYAGPNHTNAVVPALSGLLFDDQVAEPTCEMVQAVLLNQNEGSEICESSRSEASLICDCDTSNITGTLSEPDTSTLTNETGITDVGRCSLCPNGEPIAFPEREIPGFFVPTCSVLDTVTSALPNDSTDCSDARQLGIYCGCPAPPAVCSLCLDGRPIPKPDALVASVVLPGNFTPTCAVYAGLIAGIVPEHQLCAAAKGAGMKYCGCPPLEVESCVMCPGGIPEEYYFENCPLFPTPVQCGFLEDSQVGFPRRSELCFYFEQIAHTCGCRDSLRTYAGAETVVGQIVLAWAPRVSALFSISGSLLIMNVARKTPHTMYHQLMLAISASDILSSAGWFMSSWPIPPIGIDAGIWGATGNNAICKAQGVLLSGPTSASLWLNVSLSLYYKLVIVNGWRERQFTTNVRLLLLGIPPIIGATIASLAYEHTFPSGSGCNILPFPWKTRGLLFYMLMVVPMCSALVGVISLTLWVCWKFSEQMRVADKWRLSGRRRDALAAQRSSMGTVRSTMSTWAVVVSQHTLEGSVLRQSIFYLCAFCASAPAALITTILLSRFIVNFWLSLAALVLTPLQGFNNALIFFRPRIFRSCSSSFKKVAQRAAKRKKKKSNEDSDGREDTVESNTMTKRVARRSTVAKIPPPVSLNVGAADEASSHSGNEPPGDNSEASTDHRESDEFWRSHLYGSAPFEFDEDDGSLDIAELETPAQPEYTGRIRVGSLVLPSVHGSSRFDFKNWEPEVSDFVCSEEDVVHSDNES